MYRVTKRGKEVKCFTLRQSENALKSQSAVKLTQQTNKPPTNIFSTKINWVKMT